jgi:biotin carboxyl carrier protein
VTALRLEVNGTIRSLQTGREDGRLVVVLDGVRYVLDASETEPGRWSLVFESDHASHEILVRNGQPGEWIVHVDGTRVPVRAVDPRRSDKRATGSQEIGPVPVTAPMPGRVVRVLVQPGEAVAARQGVAVVEAMKMENELRAPRAGTVQAVHARAGASVEAGAVLLTIA